MMPRVMDSRLGGSRRCGACTVAILKHKWGLFDKVDKIPERERLGVEMAWCYRQ